MRQAQSTHVVPPLAAIPVRHAPAPLARQGYIRSPCDAINRETVEALARGHLRDAEIEFGGVTLRMGCTFLDGGASGFRVQGAIGRRSAPDPETLAKLHSGRALLVKAHYALWARWLAEDPAPGSHVSVSLSRLCDDLGYKRNKRGHQQKNQQAAKAAFDFLTSLYLVLVMSRPDAQSEYWAGPLWSLGGERGVLTSRGSQPISFTYAPGAWFTKRWRRHAENIALIAESFLRLSPSSEQWAILVGEYLAGRARLNQYQPKIFKVKTVLEKTGLWDAEHRQPWRMREKLERALDRAREVGLIRSCEPIIEEVAGDDDHAAEPHRWVTDWLEGRLLVSYPQELEELGADTRRRQLRAAKRSGRAA